MAASATRPAPHVRPDNRPRTARKGTGPLGPRPVAARKGSSDWRPFTEQGVLAALAVSASPGK